MTSSQLFSNGNEPSLILDVRSLENFALQHYPGSIHIALSPSFSFWANLFIPNDAKFFIISDTQTQFQGAFTQLNQIGKKNIVGNSTWNELSDLDKAKFRSLPLISTQDLLKRISAQPEIQLIDVRTDEEWNAGHIEQARHIDLRNLIENLPSLSIDKDVYLICASGNRSSIAASIMLQQGDWKVHNVLGGMHAWSVQYPVSRSF